MRRSAVIPFGLVAMLALGACGGDEGSATAGPATGFPITVDSCGREVTIEEPPERVLTVASVAAPLVAAAGAADRIVARTFETASFLGEYSDELADAALVSRTEELSREEIIARDPDLVITYEGSDNAPADLEAAGIDAWVSSGYCLDTAQGDFEEIFADIETLGRLLGTEDAATREIAALSQRVDAVREQAQGAQPGRSAAALIFNRDSPTIDAYGDRSTVDQQMEILGLANAFDDVDLRTIEPSIEEIIARDPDVIILLTQADQEPASTRAALLARPELQPVTAIRNDDIVVLPFGYTGPGPVAIEGLETMAGRLAGLD